MATRKRAEKSPEKRQNEYLESESSEEEESTPVSLSRSPRSRAAKLHTSPSISASHLHITNLLCKSGQESRTRKRSIKVEENEEDQSNYMSLDVLAQVASETLESEPKRNNKKTMRLLSSLEILNLKQIKTLSDKFLVNFYAEMSSNEMTRNFIYTCYLMPRKCQTQFKSFGNESGARMKMRNHLHKHLEQLVDEENDPDRKERFYFEAEPVHMKNKRLAEMAAIKKTKKMKFTALKTSKYDNIPNTTTPAELKSGEVTEESRDSMDQISGDENDSSSLQRSDRTKIITKQPNKEVKSGNRIIKGKNDVQPVEQSDNYCREETERRLEENEQLIIELLSRTQPHHDHSYTTVFGRKKSFYMREFIGEAEEEVEVEDEDNLKFYCGREIIRPKRNAEPILCLGNVSVMDELSGYGHDEASKTIIVCSEEIVGDRSESPSLFENPVISKGHSGQRPYPPMPKCPIAKHGRIAIPEEYESLSEEERRNRQQSPNNTCIINIGPHTQKKKRKNPNELETTEWERKAALKCIRELKARKRDLMYPLYCKICTNKQFTAAATLMYHYRSHAGIKPFMCLICNTTFTRQHSLNYHMLIHNNQSRFTCKDCGRKFRHPSHFKEHLRRHTGETPFICADCPQKFKTRNTYKRHLKTRHGKLLTASGIKILTVEEFAKIRTKPYRRTPDKEVRKMVSEIKSKLEMVDNDSDVDITDEDDDDTSMQENSINIKEEESSNNEGTLADGNTLFIPLGISVNS
ncbi:uncharacterized protein LOC143069069 isoform X1 [Mytilus galloprovincialis]|uniref:uncharacterized protein LOC143069069 isoform X1 n=2 Tax=Mytilus galloprovincialis TaxID=29158 RepID=UPI003F7C2C70